MKYRSRTEIIDAILRSIKSGAARSRIVYAANLSFYQLKDYLPLLEGSGLVEFDDEKSIFTITERGLRYVSAYAELTELVPSANSENDRRRETIAGFPFEY